MDGREYKKMRLSEWIIYESRQRGLTPEEVKYRLRHTLEYSGLIIKRIGRAYHVTGREYMNQKEQAAADRILDLVLKTEAPSPELLMDAYQKLVSASIFREQNETRTPLTPPNPN